MSTRRFVIKANLYAFISIRKEYLLALVTLLSTIASGLVLPATAILTGRVFDLLTQIDRYTNKELLHHELVLRSMSIMALGVLSFPLTWISISSWMLVGEKQGLSVRRQILASYMRKTMRWLDSNDNLSGRFTQLHRCVEELRSGSAETSALTSRSIVTIIALICTSLYYSWSLTLVATCSTPIIAAVAFIFSKLIEKNVLLENEHTSRASKLLNWTMNSARFVKLSCTQLREIAVFQKYVQESKRHFLHMCMYSAANTAILRFLSLTMFVQSFWFGSIMISKGKLNVGDVITCFHSCVLLGATLNGVLHQFIILQKGGIAAHQILEFLTEGNEQVNEELPKYPSVTTARSDITFENVSFSYPGRPTEPVLHKLSLMFPGGKTTYIVGKSGSGKSTLSNLLLRLYDVSEGEIKIGGINIKAIPHQWLTHNISLIEQKCTLFNDTIKNNILLGLRDDLQKDLDSVLKSACRISLLEKFLFDIPEGLDTLIGSGGMNLSGGQQQRMAIARAYIRDTPVLILDEATSALDRIHRHLLIKAVKNWRKGKTTIILTHDLDQIDSEDFLFLFKDGNCIEKGYQHTLLNDIHSVFFQWKNLRYLDDTDNCSQLTTVDNDYCKDKLTDTYIEMDVETPKLEEDKKFFPEIYDISIVAHSKKHEDRTRIKRVITSEISDSLTGHSYVEKEKANEPLLSIYTICKKLWKVNQSKSLLIIGFLFSLLAGAANPVFSYTFSFLLNGIVPSGNGVGSRSYLLKWSFIVMSVALSDALFSFLKDVTLGYLGEFWITSLRNEAMRKITFKELAWFFQAQNNESLVSSLIMNDLRDLRSFVTDYLGTLSTFIMISVLGLIWALISGWKLSLVCISMFPLMLFFCTGYGILLQTYETTYKTSVAALESLVYEVAMGIKTVKCLQLERHFWKKYDSSERDLKTISKYRAICIGLGIAGTEGLATCIQSILFYFALKLVMDAEYTTEKMFKTFTLLLFTIMSCSNLVSQIPDVSRGQRASTWLAHIIDDDQGFEPFMVSGYEQKVIDLNGEYSTPLISVKNLTFSYPALPSVKVFNGLNLRFFAGSTIAIAGESGSGKSTLLYLLTRLYKTEPGTLEIGGVDINQWELYDLRNRIAVVEQKPTIVLGSIRENLMYGCSHVVSDIEIFDMIRYVGIFKFINHLPEGIETIIDSDLLSGGQAQILCIARALLRKPLILILDECTSALDPASSHIITEIIRNNPPAMLTLSITHSEDMMKSCDEVIYLKRGKVIEQGPFDTLIAQRGELYRMIASI